jgi:hypothetical protein
MVLTVLQPIGVNLGDIIIDGRDIHGVIKS